MDFLGVGVENGKYEWNSEGITEDDIEEQKTYDEKRRTLILFSFLRER